MTFMAPAALPRPPGVPCEPRDGERTEHVGPQLEPPGTRGSHHHGSPASRRRVDPRQARRPFEALAELAYPTFQRPEHGRLLGPREGQLRSDRDDLLGQHGHKLGRRIAVREICCRWMHNAAECPTGRPRRAPKDRQASPSRRPTFAKLDAATGVMAPGASRLDWRRWTRRGLGPRRRSHHLWQCSSLARCGGDWHDPIRQ